MVITVVFFAYVCVTRWSLTTYSFREHALAALSFFFFLLDLAFPLSPLTPPPTCISHTWTHKATHSLTSTSRKTNWRRDLRWMWPPGDYTLMIHNSVGRAQGRFYPSSKVISRSGEPTCWCAGSLVASHIHTCMQTHMKACVESTLQQTRTTHPVLHHLSQDVVSWSEWGGGVSDVEACQGHPHYIPFLSSVRWDHNTAGNVGFIRVPLQEGSACEPRPLVSHPAALFIKQGPPQNVESQSGTTVNEKRKAKKSNRKQL